MPVPTSFTPHCLDGIGPFDCLPAQGLTCKGGGSISTLDACVLGIELKDEIGVSISIDILQGRLHRSSLSTGCAKEDCIWVYGGGIKGASRQDGHRDHPLA